MSYGSAFHIDAWAISIAKDFYLLYSHDFNNIVIQKKIIRKERFKQREWHI